MRCVEGLAGAYLHVKTPHFTVYSEMGSVLSPGSPTDAGMVTLCEIIVLL